ncbi:MAG: hypothetical protein AB7Q69_01020 [Gemmatimonadales bacterium]
MFESLRARLEQFLAEHTAPADARAYASQLQDAVVEAKVAVSKMQEDLAATERELTVERKHLDDAIRRGRLASDIQDQETADLARTFVDRHTERSAVLERKLAVQREELALAMREFEELRSRFRQARQGLGPAGASTEAAWRDIQAAGGNRPGVDPAEELLGRDLDQSARQAAVEQQLAYLKKKLGKDQSKP